MNTTNIEILDQFIGLELSVADLYTLFYNTFPEDEKFWWTLLLEEKNHAALIRSIKHLISLFDESQHPIFSCSLDKLKETRARIAAMIADYQTNPPTRREALVARPSLLIQPLPWPKRATIRC